MSSDWTAIERAQRPARGLGDSHSRVRSLTALACAAVVGCGGTPAPKPERPDGGSSLSPIAAKHAYAEAENVCSELGVRGVADEYKSPRVQAAAARAYAKEFLKPYRDAVYSGCRAGLATVPPDQVPCVQLKTRQAAHLLARKLVDRVVAPEGQPERQTIGIIGESLYATCRQPRLPGVDDVDDYRAVKPVLREIQRDFDQDEITGG